ncbi:MAG: 16S rRNA (cytidine(1402)-2'-O)-methyltransferase [Oligoflexus sp.]|nr:16S rRNA (cytidine(1402)-2'-O)-methyltransferase [Oligoflexus sp.]
MTPESAIYVVATPIGNLDDLTLRAIKVLKSVDIIAAEDTRRARHLLQHIGRDKAEVISYFDHVEREKAPQLVDRILENSLSLALISDAGTPCISDPGYHLVREARKRGVAVHPVPGPSALTALVSASGLPSDRLLFVGFLPNKKMALEKEIASWRSLSASIVFYENPRRLKASLTVIHALYPNAELVIGRELTKLHEEILLTDPSGALSWCNNHDFLKGEAVVMVRLGDALVDTQEIKDNKREALILEARDQFNKDATLKDLLGLYRDRGLSRSELYQLLLEAKGFYGNEK